MSRSTTGPTDDEWDTDRALRGIATVNEAVTTASLKSQFELLPDTAFVSTQDFDTDSVWYERNGGTVSGRVADGVDRLIDLDLDGAQTDSYASVETAPIVVYRSGTKVFGAVGAWVDDYPTGDAHFDIEYGREPRTLTKDDGTTVDVGTEFYRLRTVSNPDNDPPVDLEFTVGTDYDDDGVGESNTVTVTDTRPGEVVDFDTAPKAKYYAIDPFDGDGPTERTFDPKVGYIYGFLLGWYGPSSVVPYLTTTANMYGNVVERIWPLGIYDPIETPSLLRPNQPLKATVDNGTSGQALSARVGGRQATYFGDIQANPNPTQHYAIGQTHDGSTGTVGDVTGSNWQVAAVIKRKANRPGTALGLIKTTLSTSSGLAVQGRVVPESKITESGDGLTYTDPTDYEDTESSLLVDCASDTPSRVSLGTETKDDGSTKLVGKKYDGDFVGQGKNDLTLGETTSDFVFPLVRTNPTVILLSVRDRTASPDVDIAFKVAEEG